jgi:arginine/serine-rich splicing factor 16
MWHEARRSEKKVHDMMDAARKRAQRRAVYLAKRRGDPQQSIQVVGSRSRAYRDDALYQATEDQQGLLVSLLFHFVQFYFNFVQIWD